MEKQLADQALDGALAQLLLDYMAEKRLQPDGLSTSLLSYVRSKRMTHRQWWQALQTVQDQFPERRTSLDIGQRIEPQHLGVLGYLLLSSSSLAELMMRYQRFMPLVHDSDHAEVVMRDSEIQVRWTTHYGLAPLIADELYFSAIIRFVRRATGVADLCFRRLHLSHPAPEALDEYHRVFACPLEFQQPQVGFDLALGDLHRPLNHADPALAGLLEQQAHALLDASSQQTSFVEDLKKHLITALEDGRVDADSIAAKLAMSRRTLHRRLAEEGLDFRSLLAQVREQLARQYLKNPRLSLPEVALLLGYSDQSTFSRAFKSWTMMSPRQYRHQH